MGALTTLRSGARAAAQHPQLVRWYLRNRVRLLGLGREQRSGDGHSRPPMGITLKPTFCCNLRCSMCSFNANGSILTHPRESLALDVWSRLVDDVKAWNPYLWFTGGEPTLYPQFIELLHYIKRQGLLAGVTTNGTTLEKFATRILEAPMDLVVVSIDGKEDIHNKVRGNPAAFVRATQGVRTLKSEQRTRGLKSPLVVVSTAMSPDSYEHIADVLDIAHDIGADALNFQHLWQMTPRMVRAHNAKWGDAHRVSEEDWGGDEVAAVDVDRLSAAIARVRSLPSRIPVVFQPDIGLEDMRTYYMHPEEFVKRRPAACAWLNTDVLPNGDVSPCFDMVVGNVLERPFTEIWNMEPARDHRRRLSVDGDFPICARCCAYWRRD